MAKETASSKKRNHATTRGRGPAIKVKAKPAASGRGTGRASASKIRAKPAASRSSRAKAVGVKSVVGRAKVSKARKSKSEEWTYDRLWDAREIAQGWNHRNTRFWRSQTADVRGTTGGGVSQPDLVFSRQALAALVAARGGGRFHRALDLGAGVGRVTDAVLRHHCEHVELVEFVQKLLQKAKAKLPAAGKAGCTFSFKAAAAQKFEVPVKSYDLIWVQWLFMYLTDADVLKVLKRLARGLSSGGILLVKENVSTPGVLTYFDRPDGEQWGEGDQQGPTSVVRTNVHYEDLFERAGLSAWAQKLDHDPTEENTDKIIWLLSPRSHGNAVAEIAAMWERG